MMNLEHLVGLQLKNLYASFFFEEKIDFSSPMSIYVPDGKGAFSGLSPDGKGGVKETRAFSDIYFAEEIGFTFLTSFLLVVSEIGVGNQTIESVNIEHYPNCLDLNLALTDEATINLHFEDDSLIVTIKKDDLS